MEPSSKERKIVTVEVPEKAFFDILVRSPIKSVLRNKLVSKGVASIITSTDFIESHMERSGRSYELVTFANDSKKYGYASVLLSEEDPDRSESVDLLNFEFLSTCRGLVLLVDNRSAVKQQLYVSNPAIKKTVALPIINESFYIFTAGLGFNAEEKTYKVLVLSTNKRNKMYICRFRPSNIDEPIEWEDVSSLAPSSYARKKNVFMKGAIHWVAYKKEDETHQRNSVLFYNVKTEDFSEMNFPSSIEVTVASNYLLGGEEFKVDISTTDQSIQLVVGSFLHDTGFDIWIMNKYGNPISWSKRSHISPFTIPRNTDYRLNECLSEQTWMDRLSNRQIDFDDKLDEPLGIRNGEAVWWKTKKGFLALHDAATRNIRYAPNIRHTQVEGLQLFPDPMFVAKYKESLVLLPEVHFQISTNPLSRPLPPLLDGLPTAVQKEISVLNQHNEKLVGVLHDTRSREIVVLCHGFKSSKYGNYCREVDDLHSVVKYFNGEGRKVTAILGHREGGNVVLLYASMHHDVQTVINLSGCYNLKEGIAEHLGKDFEAAIKKYGYIDVKNVAGNSDYRVTEKSLMDLLATNMDEAYVQIDKNCRVLTVHGSADIISSEDALEFNKKISNHKSHIIQGATHCYMLMSHQDELTTAVLSFIKEDQLQN